MVSKQQLQYLHPNCTLTLREGIAELRAAEGAFRFTIAIRNSITKFDPIRQGLTFTMPVRR